ncbi:MAG: hypothetical protein ACRDL5_18525 [Solirubrobacteraceae bacterium]
MSLTAPGYLSTPAATVGSDAIGYLLLEEARLRCEDLRHAGPGSPRTHSEPPRRLAQLYRELGLAGFYAGAELVPWTRHGLLALARARCERVMPNLEERLLALFTTTMSAQRALDAALQGSRGAEHIGLAHVHLLVAEKHLALVLLADQPTTERT